MKKLKNILYGLELIAVRGSNEIMISGISVYSKKTHKKNLFVAINGINENIIDTNKIIFDNDDEYELDI